jgi:peptide-methionine (S)-S-oxide reductase
MMEKQSPFKGETAAFGAGCFWGVENAFRELKGVHGTMVGYMDGYTQNPTYKEVCTDKTGYAEVVLVEFDPTVVSYEALLETFWNSHDPTQYNRQGPDVGSQYRSVIFYYSEAQREAAEHSRTLLERSGKYNGTPIVTDIKTAPTFYKAEEYHQQYLEKRGIRGQCHI